MQNVPAFDRDAYRARIRQALEGGQPVIQQPAAASSAFGVGEQALAPPEGEPPAMPQQAPRGAFGAPEEPPVAPVQSSGALGQSQERKKIPILPAGMKPTDLEFEEGAVEKVKTPGDLMNALKPKSRDQFLSAWEKERGSIDQKYSAMLQDLGQRPDANKKLSKQDKFAMLMEFGLNLMKASQRGSGNSLGGAIAQSAGATFAGQRQKELAAPVEFDKKRGALLGARAAEMKEIGSRSGALKDASTIDRNEAAAERDRGYADEVVGTESLTSGVVGRTRGGAFRKMIDPNTGKPAQVDPKAKGNGATTAYEVEHGYLSRMHKRKGMSPEEAEDAATRDMQKRGNAGSAKSFRRLAADSVKQILSGSEAWKEATPEERTKMRADALEEERRQMIQDAYGIDLTKKMHRGLGATVGMGELDRKPSQSDLDELKQDPSAANEFYDFFGYLPDDFWPE